MGNSRLVKPLIVSAIVTVTLLSSASADVPKKEKQSHFMTAKDPGGQAWPIWSSSLYRRMKDLMTTNWENVGIMINACYSGEFVTRAATKLPDKWSVSTATIADKQGTVAKDVGNNGLPIGNTKYDGHLAQYMKKLDADKAGATFKGVHDEAVAKSPYAAAEKPQYDKKPDAASGFKFHGGNQANRALVFGVNGRNQKFSFNPLFDKMYDVIKGSGFAPAEIRYLRDNDAAAGNINGAATEGGLDGALRAIGDVIDATGGANKNKTGVALMLMGHGGFTERTVVYNDNGVNQPGGGAIVSATNTQVDLFVDDPTVVAGIKEDLPRSPANGGGFWLDDPVIDRAENPFLVLTTLSETFTTADTDVEVLLNGLSLGTVEMGHSPGADYQFELSDTMLDALMPSIDADGRLDVEFSLPSSSDSFKLAVEEDFELPGFTQRGYGLSIGFAVTATVPEPASVMLFLLGGAPCLTNRRRLRAP